MTKSKKKSEKSAPDGVDAKSAPAEKTPANVAAVAKPKEKAKAKSKSAKAPADQKDAAESAETEPQKDINNKEYEKALAGLQIELVKLQEWIKFKKLKVVVIFE